MQQRAGRHVRLLEEEVFPVHPAVFSPSSEERILLHSASDLINIFNSLSEALISSIISSPSRLHLTSQHLRVPRTLRETRRSQLFPGISWHRPRLRLPPNISNISNLLISSLVSNVLLVHRCNKTPTSLAASITTTILINHF